jgi:hypothetical protein
MVNLKITAYLLFFVASISGCAFGPQVSTPQLSSLPDCGVDGKGQVGGYQFALLDMSQSRIGQIRLIDRKPFTPKDCNYFHVVIPPGEHTVHFVYQKSLYLLHPRGRDPVALKFKAEAGKTYLTIVDKHPIRSLYNCRIVEASSGAIIFEEGDCDSDEVRYPAMKEILDVFGGREAYLQYQSEWWPDEEFEALHKHLR